MPLNKTELFPLQETTDLDSVIERFISDEVVVELCQDFYQIRHWAKSPASSHDDGAALAKAEGALEEYLRSKRVKLSQENLNLLVDALQETGKE